MEVHFFKNFKIKKWNSQNLTFLGFCFNFSSRHIAYEISVPCPGMELGTPCHGSMGP